MPQDIKNFVVAICNQHDEIWGTGFLIAPKVVVTCAHVVAAGEVDPGEIIHFKFPNEDTLFQAEVVANSYDFNNDVAILKCSAELPLTIQPAILGRWQEAKHTGFFSYGYRPLDAYRGNPAEGRLLREVSDIQPLAGEPVPTHPILNLASQQISPGMSGSPVYIPATDRVVGMITAIWNRSGRDRDTAFAISAEAIVVAWPGVSLRPGSNEMVGQNSEAETKPSAATENPEPARKDRETTSRVHSMKVSWIKPYAELSSVPSDGDAITTMLKGVSPFPHRRAEFELPFLFGSTGGFWSGHSIYAQVVGNPVAQVVLADAGAGKTAFAYALRQVGTPEGNPIANTLPVLLSENTAITLGNAKSRIVRALLTLLHHNLSLLVDLPSAEKTVVLKCLVGQFGPTEITRQLRPAIRQDDNLPGLIGQFSQTGKQATLPQIQSLLSILGFRQLALAIDANRRPAGQIKTWLNNMKKWSGYGINPVLFLPLDRQMEFDPLLGRADVKVLTWTERQLTAMATWRFERMVNWIGVHISLEELFEGDLFNDFVWLSNRSPRRMAHLWEKMSEYHTVNHPSNRMFSQEDLEWATGQVNDD